MQQLRESCTEAGLGDVRTYIASGNLLCSSSLSKKQLTSTVEDVLREFGLDNAVILRDASELGDIISASPMPEAARTRPNHLLTVFFNQTVTANAVDDLMAREFPERIVVRKREICIDYRDGVARSKLTPALIDRTIGHPGTARNWNTLQKLFALSRA